MGWLITQGATRADIIRNLTVESTRESADGGCFRTLRKAAAGNVLYALHEVAGPGGADRHTFIAVYLLRGDRGFGWGYKDMDEGMGPCEKTCSLAILNDPRLSPPRNEWAAQWRADCRANAAAKAAQRGMARELLPGDVAVLRVGCRPGRVVVSLVGRGKVIGRDADGRLYRVNPRHIDADATRAANAAPAPAPAVSP